MSLLERKLMMGFQCILRFVENTWGQRVKLAVCIGYLSNRNLTDLLTLGLIGARRKVYLRSNKEDMTLHWYLFLTAFLTLWKVWTNIVATCLAHLADHSFLKESLDFCLKYIEGLSWDGRVTSSNPLPLDFIEQGRLVASPEYANMAPINVNILITIRTERESACQSFRQPRDNGLRLETSSRHKLIWRL